MEYFGIVLIVVLVILIILIWFDITIKSKKQKIAKELIEKYNKLILKDIGNKELISKHFNELTQESAFKDWYTKQCLSRLYNDMSIIVGYNNLLTEKGFEIVKPKEPSKSNG